MTGSPTQPNRPDGRSRDNWGQPAYYQGGATPLRGRQPPEPLPQKGNGGQGQPGLGCGLISLVLLALTVLCVTGFLIARVFLADSRPALPPIAGGATSTLAAASGAQTGQPPGPSGQVQLAINPTQGYINTLITVTGQGWWPGEPVFILLRSRQEGDGPGFAYAAAVADERGYFRTALTFPNEMRWIGEPWADVIARGARSGREVSTRFMLVAPPATHTLPPPTARPTSAVTATPVSEATPTETPVSEATPAATPTPDVIITDWRGEYFDNPYLSGAPALVRNDVHIDFNWGAGSPASNIPVDGFSARWTRHLKFSEGPYQINVTADDGVRLWMDGQLLVDEWHDSSQTTYSVDLYVSQGGHDLHLEYYEGLGGAMVQFVLSKGAPPTATPTPTPSATLPPTPEPTDTPPPTPGPTDTPLPTVPPSALPDRWPAAYFDNPALIGEPVLRRKDGAIDFDWGAGSPDPSLPTDGFSARWVAEVWLPGGAYRYFLTADDGARVLIDGRLLIDAWPAVPGQVLSVQILLPEGVHTFQVEYFEGTGDALVRFWGEQTRGP